MLALPPAQRAVYDAIAAGSVNRRGCWDVFAWRDGEILFAESKRAQRDRIRDSQLHEDRVGAPLSAYGPPTVC
jgi:Holliday junction resolvase